MPALWGTRRRRDSKRPPLRGAAAATTAALLGALALPLASPPPARAANKLEGYYEVETSLERQDRRWRLGPPGSNGQPKHYGEFKFWSWPGTDLEMFVKLRAESNRDDDRTPAVDFYRPPWLTAEGHLKLRRSHWEAFLFSRQNRFWINDEPLFNLVNEDKLKNDSWGPKSQGVRFDFWEARLPLLRKLGGTVIYSDDGGTYNWNDGRGDIPNGVDSWIVRLRNRAWRDRLEMGATFLRKDWTDSSSPDNTSRLGIMYNAVYGADLAFFPRELTETGLHLGPLNLEQSRWTVEWAASDTPYREQVFGEPNDHDSIVGFEARDLNAGNLTLHAWHFNFGENFRDYLSKRFDNEDKHFNRVQNHVEGIYLVPRKAITAKISYDHYRKRTETPDEIGGGLRPTTEWYGETYIEFVKGFKGKLAYKSWHGFDASPEVFDFYTYPNYYAEVSVENFLAKIRIQARLRDAGTFRELSAFGFDMNVNLTEKLKGYLRMLTVDEETEGRQTLFAQLKYDLGPGAEFYFEYGDPGQSDNLIYTDWFVSEGNNDPQRDRIKLLLKTWF